ncbi:acyl-CoA N-acyltransferase [Polychaeton citri CBS 116435]|uniref:Acyl-CoA N-acyltransferase n=1 Tax=Polychaeton citri CBS 116435 TaxID=1314669 RepID=A0A9P4QFS9_9PEZI|nr:acyl-CoA N-acyltransferase [Polychaeton citri CBS 116435]
METPIEPKEEFGQTILTLPDGICAREQLESDATSLAYHGNNKKVWDNLRDRMPHPYTQADALSWIKRCQEPESYVKSGAWDPTTNTSSGPAIATKHAIIVDGKAVGGIGLEFGDPNDVYKRAAEIGYWIGEEFWGKGIMSTLVPAYVNWAWRTFGILIRLNACHYERNVGSGKVLMSAGFKLEGKQEAAAWKNGRVEADILYGQLRPTES